MTKRKKGRKQKGPSFPQYVYGRQSTNFEVDLLHLSQNPSEPSADKPLIQAVYKLLEIQEVTATLVVKKRVISKRV